MTTDLKKQFFSTFEIEPREYKSCDVGTFCPYPEKECGTDTCPYYRTYKVDYPAITDRHYLELERICGEIVWYMGDSLIYEIDKKENKAVDFRHKYYAKEYSDRIYITGLTKKEALLKLCINSYVKEIMKHQVQELFRGE